MAKTIKVDGKLYKVPDDATPYEIDQIVSGQGGGETEGKLANPAEGNDSPLLSKVTDWAQKPTVSPDTMMGGGLLTRLINKIRPGTIPASEADYQQRLDAPPSEFESRHPIYSGIKTAVTGAGRDINRLSSSLTSPVSLALAALTEGESAAGESTIPAVRAVVPALKSAQVGLSTGVGLQGLSQAVTEQQPGESETDEIQRRLYGGSAAAGGAAGALGFSRGIAPKTGARLVSGKSSLDMGMSPWLSGIIGHQVAGEPYGFAGGVLANKVLGSDLVNRTVGEHLQGPLRPTGPQTLSPLDLASAVRVQSPDVAAMQNEIQHIGETMESPLGRGVQTVNKGGRPFKPVPNLSPEEPQLLSPLEQGKTEVAPKLSDSGFPRDPNEEDESDWPWLHRPDINFEEDTESKGVPESLLDKVKKNTVSESVPTAAATVPSGSAVASSEEIEGRGGQAEHFLVDKNGANKGYLGVKPDTGSAAGTPEGHGVVRRLRSGQYEVASNNTPHSDSQLIMKSIPEIEKVVQSRGQVESQPNEYDLGDVSTESQLPQLPRSFREDQPILDEMRYGLQHEGENILAQESRDFAAGSKVGTPKSELTRQFQESQPDLQQKLIDQYHGTSSKFSPQIERTGLDARTVGEEDDPTKLLYGSRDESMARLFADMAVDTHGGKPVVYKYQLPEGSTQSISSDEGDVVADWFKGGVPAKNLTRLKSQRRGQ